MQPALVILTAFVNIEGVSVDIISSVLYMHYGLGQVFLVNEKKNVNSATLIKLVISLQNSCIFENENFYEYIK